MNKSFRSTLILLGVFVVLSLWYVIYEKRIKFDNNESKEKEKQLVTLKREEIQELTLTKLKNPPSEDAPADAEVKFDFETFKLKKTGEDWVLTAPLETPADNATISSMISTLTTSKQERVVDEKPTNLKQYGLETPYLTINLKKDASSAGETLLLGRNTPVGYAVYAKIAGSDTVYRAPRSLRTTFEKELKAYRQKMIFSLARGEVGEVEIQRKGENILVKKDDKENWFLTRENIPVDVAEWTKSLNAIVDIKAVDFVAEQTNNLAQYGLSQPLVAITLSSTKEKGKVGIWLGEVKDKVYAKRVDKPTIYQVDKEILKKVNRSAAEYRSQKVVSFNRFDVKRIKLERAKESLELKKEGSQWAISEDAAAKLDNAKVDGLLVALQDAKLKSYVTDKSASVKNPELTIRLFETKDGKETEAAVLKLAKLRGDYVAERSQLPIPFVVKSEDFNKWNLSKGQLLAPPPAEAPKTSSEKSPNQSSEKTNEGREPKSEKS